MRRKVTRTEWRAIALDMTIETSAMEVLLRSGSRQQRPIVRVVFRTASGREFSGPRINRALRRELEESAELGTWLRGPKKVRRRS